MTISKRTLFAAIAVALLPVQAAFAQTFDRQITLVAPYGVGTLTDTIARVVGEKMGEKLNQRILIDNRLGASGMIGAEFVARRPPDGYTLLLGNNQIMATNPNFFKEVRYDPVKDFTPIGLVTVQEWLLVVNSTLPVKTLPELIAYAKANPGKLSFGSTGLGTLGHLSGEMLKTAANIDMVHVPYTSGQVFTDLLSGVIQVVFYPYSGLKAHVDSGAVRPLGFTGTSRLAALPQVPTMTELGYPQMVLSAWTAVYGPKGLPPKMVEELSAALKYALESPEMKTKFGVDGARLDYVTPDQLAKFTASEFERVGPILRAAGVEKQ